VSERIGSPLTNLLKDVKGDWQTSYRFLRRYLLANFANSYGMYQGVAVPCYYLSEGIDYPLEQLRGYWINLVTFARGLSS
jgi:hypothetical protein